ncbi:MAG: RDD family protein [Bacilli bacterium]|nr:RDD family protein [Bacilli bacterium]
MKKPTFRRVLAYIVDALLVAIVASMFARLTILNPEKEKYTEVYQEYSNYIQEIMKSEDFSPDIIKSDVVVNMTYDLAYYGVYTSIISLVLSFLYFGIFQYYTGGKTIGKLLFGIKVISTKHERLNMIQLIIRSAIINSLLTSAVLIILVLYTSKEMYINANQIVQIIDNGLLLASFCMILYRPDGVGLHDLLAGTAVVNNYETYSDYIEVYKGGVVKEAKYTEVEHKKTTPKKRTKKEEK